MNPTIKKFVTLVSSLSVSATVVAIGLPEARAAQAVGQGESAAQVRIAAKSTQSASQSLRRIAQN